MSMLTHYRMFGRYNAWANRRLYDAAAALGDSDYRADRGSQRYGSEWNVSLGRAFGSRWSGLLKIADYRADGCARDTRKVWLQAEWAF